MLYLLIAGLGYFLAALPEGVLAAICRGCGWLVATLPGRRRRTLRANLQHAFPEKTESWRRAIALESARRTMEMGFFVLASPYFSQARLQRQFSLHEELLRLIQRYQAAPGPLVIIVPHFSLMEAITLLPMLSGGTFPPVGVVYRPFNSPGLERWVKATRERWGLRLLSRKEGYFQAVDLLRHDGVAAVLFDQNAGDRGALTLFFNRVCSTSELAGLLTEKCKARLGVIYTERQGFMRAVIRGEYIDVAQKEETVIFAANHWLESKLQTNDGTCADWLWLHSRWRHQDDPPRRFHLQSRHDLLPAQLGWLGQKVLPRRTRFFVRLPNWLGDVVMALPLLRALHNSRPDAEITLLAKPELQPLLERLAVADRFIALPLPGSVYAAFFGKLSEEYPDTHILFTNSFRGDYEARRVGAPQRFGMVRPGKWRPLLTHSWLVPRDLNEAQIHQTRVWERFFRRFGLKGELDLSPCAWPDSEVADSEGPVVGMICGTENLPDKRWPVEHWRELAQLIQQNHADAHIVLFGTARDAEIINAVAAGHAPERVTNLAGKTNLLEFAEGLAECDVVVCNDTGGMHLANALGVPVVALYGPTNPVRTGPIFDAPRIILQPPGCPATGGVPLTKLPVLQVYEAVKPWLGQSERQGSPE